MVLYRPRFYCPMSHQRWIPRPIHWPVRRQSIHQLTSAYVVLINPWYETKPSKKHMYPSGFWSARCLLNIQLHDNYEANFYILLFCWSTWACFLHPSVLLRRLTQARPQTCKISCPVTLTNSNKHSYVVSFLWFGPVLVQFELKLTCLMCENTNSIQIMMSTGCV